MSPLPAFLRSLLIALVPSTIRGIGSEDPEASKGLVSEDALVAEREALEGQTGLTDSEPEDEY